MCDQHHKAQPTTTRDIAFSATFQLCSMLSLNNIKMVKLFLKIAFPPKKPSSFKTVIAVDIHEMRSLLILQNGCLDS